MHRRTAAWTFTTHQGISLARGFIPYWFDHPDDYVSRFSNPSSWLWRLMEIVVIAPTVLYIRKGVAIARYVTTCVISMLFFAVMPIVLVVDDSVWYYTFMPEPSIYKSGLLGAHLLLIRVLDWVCVIAVILLAIPDSKLTPSPYVTDAPIPAAGATPADHVTPSVVMPEGAPSEAALKSSSAQAMNVSIFTAPQQLLRAA